MTTDDEMTQSGSSLDLRKYALLLWRWLWLIVLCALFAGGAVYIVNRFTKPVYSATAVLLVNVAPSGTAGTDYGSLSASQQVARTYVELLRTSDMLDKVVAKLELPLSSESLMKRVRVQVVANTQLIQITAEDTDPQRAAAIVNTLAQVFQETNEEQQLSRYANLSASLTSQIQQVGNNIATTQADIAVMPTVRKPTRSGQKIMLSPEQACLSGATKDSH